MKNWIAYALVIIVIALVLVARISTKDPKKEPELSSFQLDSIRIEKSMKVLMEETSKRFEEEMKLNESYRKGFEAGLNEQQKREAYKRGFEEAKNIFKQDADYYRNELERLIEDAGKKTSTNDYLNPVKEESVIENKNHLGIENVSDLYERSMPSSEYDTIHYLDDIDYLDERNLFFGFTSDLSVGLTDGNPVQIESWNYLGINYQFGEDENISLHFGYSRSGYRLMCSADWLKKPNFTFYATEKVTWGGNENGLSLSLGVERKWSNSPLSVYSELGGSITNKLHPYCEVGLRLNFQKKIWEFK